jgi:hypothetical protein
MTTHPHPPLDIPALRRMEAAATRGPWEQDQRDVETADGTKLVAQLVDDVYEYASDDAALIVAARNNLVGLMDRVEELEKLLAESVTALEDMDLHAEFYFHMCDEACEIPCLEADEQTDAANVFMAARKLAAKIKKALLAPTPAAPEASQPRTTEE